MAVHELLPKQVSSVPPTTSPSLSPQPSALSLQPQPSALSPDPSERPSTQVGGLGEAPDAVFGELLSWAGALTPTQLGLLLASSLLSGAGATWFQSNGQRKASAPKAQLWSAILCRKLGWTDPTCLSRSGAKQASPAPEGASGCPTLRLASPNRPPLPR